jgi:selenocysteine-specific elongation factor
VQVIGTAGHVDHGKSTLIKHLTGINPDRLKEEQDRQMSIELGFAWFELPNGQEVGIVDVPGHRDFIENMLAGIGGIDATLFVVAADEGVMPQTREHLAILDLLRIPAGVIALTKIDLIQDSEWLDLVEVDLREVLAGTVLADAPLVRVSARTGAGMDELIQALQNVLSQHPHRPDLGRPRLPIDRVFTLPGFGTIVTGTLIDGQLSVGDPVQILPTSIEGRIRSLQTHKQAENTALPGGRTAVNISGVHVDQIERGQVLVHPGTYQATKMIDVWCDLLPDAEDALRHNTEVKVFLGAAEVMARVRLLGVEELSPGDGAYLQLMLQKPLVTRRGDRFIIRRPSPSATIGGGQILDAHPQHRHKRFNLERLAALESLLIGSPEEIFLQTAHKLGPTSLDEIIKGSGLEADTAKKVADALIASGTLIPLKGHSVILTAEAVERITADIQRALSSFHAQNPLRLGMPREQLKSQLKLSTPIFDALISRMATDQVLEEFNAKLRMRGHQVVFSEKQQEQIRTLLIEFTAQPFSPPTVKQSLEAIGETLLTALVETGQLIQVDEDVLFQPEIFQHVRTAVVTHIQTHGSITLAELRDKFGTSRKYAVALLEYLDKTSVTVRRGDVRVLRRPM